MTHPPGDLRTRRTLPARSMSSLSGGLTFMALGLVLLEGGTIPPPLACVTVASGVVALAVVVVEMIAATRRATHQRSCPRRR